MSVLSHYERNKELYKKKAKAWAKENPEKRKRIVKRNNDKSKLRKRLWHERKYFGGNVHLWGKKCKVCKVKTDLVVHHIDGCNGRQGKRVNHKAENLVVLCRSCHPKFHKKHWVKEVVST